MTGNLFLLSLPPSHRIYLFSPLLLFVYLCCISPVSFFICEPYISAAAALLWPAHTGSSAAQALQGRLTINMRPEI